MCIPEQDTVPSVHFYIYIPSQHHRRRVFVDRNEIHFDSAEHNVLDEEPLNSAEYAQRSEPFRSNRGLGERRE